MKIEKVEEHKIKVTLSESDLMYYNLNPKQITRNSPELHRFLFQIMENVRNQTGFNPYFGQIAVEAVSTNDGMTLIISRISPETNQKNKSKKIKATAVKRVLSRNRYFFDDFDNLCEAICKIDNEAHKKSALYKYNGQWYFILGECNFFEKQHCILSEYCESFGGGVCTESFLSEHGELLANGEKLISMVNGIKELNK